MKSFIIKFVLLAMCFSCLGLGAFAQKLIDDEYATKTVYENEGVVYRPSAKSWVVGTDEADSILLTKKVSAGSGNYSEFYNSDEELAFSFGTGMEFLFSEKLIAQDVFSMKFYSVYYDDTEKKFDRKNVVIDSLNKIFTDVKIVKFSEFKNDKLKIRKTPFKSLKILLVNDTPEYFYQYRFKGKNFEPYNLMGLLQINRMGTIEIYHPSEDFRTLYIKVRPL